jgi:hypothetical protein
MLDVWFAALAARMADASEPVEDYLPPNLRSAWNHAKYEARAIADQGLQDERAAQSRVRRPVFATVTGAPLHDPSSAGGQRSGCKRRVAANEQ